MTLAQVFLGLVAVAIGFVGGAAGVEALRSPQPRRGTLGLVSAIGCVAAVAVVVLVTRMDPVGA